MRHDQLRWLPRALRGAARQPGFFALIVVIVAIGIGATTSVFTITRATLLEALPYPDEDRLYVIWEKNLERGAERMNVSMPTVRDWLQQAAAFEEIGVAWPHASLVLSDGDEPLRLTANAVSPSILRLTGVQPLLGRLFGPEDDRAPGAHHVAILSYELWQGRYSGDPSIIGRILPLSGKPYTVIGVLPNGFVDFPLPAQETDVWVPVMMASEIFGVDMLETRTTRVYVALGRLRDGATIEQARAEMAAIDARLAEAYPDSMDGWSALIEPLRETYIGTLRPPLVALSIGAVMLLLIGSVNVANLLLVRASGRQREWSMRRALGASSARLTWKAVGEALVPVLVGAAIGIAAAQLGTEHIARLVPVEWPRFVRIHSDVAVLAAAIVIAGLIGVVAAVISILPTLRADVAGSVLPTGSARTVDAAGGKLRRCLAIAETAIAATLLVGAGLMTHSTVRLGTADIGFDPRGLLAMKIEAPNDSHGPDELRVLARQYVEAARGVPAVRSAFIWSPMVPGQSSWYTAVRPQDQPELRDDELPLVRFHYVGPGALEGLGLRFVSGRGISGADTEDGAGVIVLSESAARALWPAGDEALGKIVRRWNRDRWLTVVGIVEDAKLSGRQGLGTADNLDVYFSFFQGPWNEIVLLARVDGNAADAINPVRAAARDVAPALPQYDIETMSSRLAGQDALARFVTLLAIVFGGTAMFLATIGLYGVLAYGVCLRRREIGLRMALGARRDRVLGGVVADGIKLTAIGVALGLAAAVPLTRRMESLLYEVSPTDPLTYVGIPVLLVVVAAVACFVPARRAASVDPVTALQG